MQAKYSDNFDVVIKKMQADTAGLRITTGTVSANTKYAKYLHDRQGFYVFNNARLEMMVNKEIKLMMNLKLSLTKKRVADAAARGIVKYVSWLRSYTGASRPSWKGSGPRKAHPGGWADRNNFLKNRYRYRINGGGWRKDPSWQ